MKLSFAYSAFTGKVLRFCAVFQCKTSRFELPVVFFIKRVYAINSEREKEKLQNLWTAKFERGIIMVLGFWMCAAAYLTAMVLITARGLRKEA